MQGTRSDRGKRIILEIIPVAVILLAIFLDQWTKTYFKAFVSDNGNITVIENFFYFTYTFNTGAAWSFLEDVSWGQIFFKILTAIALVLFAIYYVYAVMKKKCFLKYALALVVGGTIGNFIDRLMMNGVRDFISFVFGSYNFPVFNLADSFLVVGVILLIINYLFIDENALLRRKKKDEKKDGKEELPGGRNKSNKS